MDFDDVVTDFDWLKYIFQHFPTIHKDGKSLWITKNLGKSWENNQYSEDHQSLQKMGFEMVKKNQIDAFRIQ